MFDTKHNILLSSQNYTMDTVHTGLISLWIGPIACCREYSNEIHIPLHARYS